MTLSTVQPCHVTAEARRWLGVRFLHQGRSAAGLDCVGLVLVVAKALGALSLDYDVKGYGLEPHPQLAEKLRAALLPSSVREGAVLLLKFAGQPRHLALCTGGTLIHAYKPRGAVIEHGFDMKWRKRVCGAYTLPGMADGR